MNDFNNASLPKITGIPMIVPSEICGVYFQKDKSPVAH